MADLTPNNREEYWLKGIVDGQTTLEPNKRREYWYKEIVDAIGSGGGGGGGSSDFSIANVTFINNLGHNVSATISVAYDEGKMGEGAPALAYPYANIPEGTSIHKVILYKGKSMFDSQGFNVALTGDITIPFERAIMVSGDGTITFTE